MQESVFCLQKLAEKVRKSRQKKWWQKSVNYTNPGFSTNGWRGIGAVQSWWFSRSQPEFWRKMKKIGGDRSPRSLTPRMYGNTSSPLWCFRTYKPYIFCENMILATSQCQNILCLVLVSYTYHIQWPLTPCCSVPPVPNCFVISKGFFHSSVFSHFPLNMESVLKLKESSWRKEGKRHMQWEKGDPTTQLNRDPTTQPRSDHSTQIQIAKLILQHPLLAE